jgi:low affinity Fe/Cu permease
MQKKFEDFSRKITRWIGSPQSIILHTVFFVVIFGLRLFGISGSDILLILTTIVSLEAIYLSIFIQMTVNKHAEELEEVSEDIEEIQEDVDEIQKDVDEIQGDFEELEADGN